MTGFLKAAAISKASSKEGVYLYFSIEITAWREIPTFSAKSACVQFFWALRTLSLFLINVTTSFLNVTTSLLCFSNLKGICQKKKSSNELFKDRKNSALVVTLIRHVQQNKVCRSTKSLHMDQVRPEALLCV